MKISPALATLSLVGLIGLPAFGQSRSDRVDQITGAISGAVDHNTTYTSTTSERGARATPGQLIRETLANVDYDQMPGKLALDIWSQQTGVPLVINWRALEAAGVDPEVPVTLTLRKVPADQVLKLIVNQIQPDPLSSEDELIIDVEQWYVRVMTKRDALRKSTTKIYFIGDLLMTVPNFTAAPGFDLNDALSNTNSGGSNGGGGGGGTGLFGTTDSTETEREPSKEEKAEKIMDMIRDTIEPDIWQANGGEYASVRYLRGMLVVKAPEFVHEQIGIPFSGTTSRRSATTSRSSSGYRWSGDGKAGYGQRRSTSGNVAGVAPRGSVVGR